LLNDRKVWFADICAQAICRWSAIRFSWPESWIPVALIAVGAVALRICLDDNLSELKWDKILPDLRADRRGDEPKTDRSRPIGQFVRQNTKHIVPDNDEGS
jgi:hypothetical protein